MSILNVESCIKSRVNNFNNQLGTVRRWEKKFNKYLHKNRTEKPNERTVHIAAISVHSTHIHDEWRNVQ